MMVHLDFAPMMFHNTRRYLNHVLEANFFRDILSEKELLYAQRTCISRRVQGLAKAV